MEGPTNLTQSKIIARVVSTIENFKCYSFENMIIKVLIYFDWNSYLSAGKFNFFLSASQKYSCSKSQNTHGYFEDRPNFHHIVFRRLFDTSFLYSFRQQKSEGQVDV